MTRHTVRFCLGCGYLCDATASDHSSQEWTEAHRYLTRHGIRWEELDRMEDACPFCARVFAIARDGNRTPPLVVPL